MTQRRPNLTAAIVAGLPAVLEAVPAVALQDADARKAFDYLTRLHAYHASPTYRAKAKRVRERTARQRAAAR